MTVSWYPLITGQWVDFCPTRVEAPWKAMTDPALEDVKTNGTLVLVASGLLVISGFWNGVEWQTESGITLIEPWKWMPMPDPIST